MQRLWKWYALPLILSVIIGMAPLGHARPTLAQGEVPVSIRLSGWGWCVAYREIGNVAADLAGYRIPRDNATDVEDIYLEGTISFNLAGRSDTFDLELRGTKTRSLFFLKQVLASEDNMRTDMLAEFEGTWLGETDYVACEGRIILPAPNHVGKPYFFLLRTVDTEIPARESGGWVGNLEFVIEKLTGAFDAAADEISSGGALIKKSLGELLAKVAIIARELRGTGIPYFM